jgi:hypothetical protein
MNHDSAYTSERSLTETVDGVVYRGRWFIDNQVIVLYVGSAGPLTRMLLGSSPEIAAQELFREFLANESSPRGGQGAAESDLPMGK